jgi:hypothetical protein
MCLNESIFFTFFQRLKARCTQSSKNLKLAAEAVGVTCDASGVLFS